MIPAHLKPTTFKQWMKLALVPVLSLVLLVLLWQRPASDKSVAEAVEPAVQAPDAAAALRPAEPQAVRRTWPKARLEDVIAFNPFDREQADEEDDSTADDSSDGIPTKGKGNNKSRSRLVSTSKLEAIFVDAQGAAAILDSQVIHVGDVLPSGGRVTAITPEGIKFEEL